jgi:hydroxymethylpyrimidine pyrophosphatase-like HAD family hydrolase
LHVIDVSGSEGRDPIDDFNKINRELAVFSSELEARPQIIVGNKCDLTDDEEIRRISDYFTEKGYRFFPVMAAIAEGTDELINYVAEKGYEGVDFVRSSIEYYEILPQNISKGTALEELRKACGMEDFTFVAAGDYNNDIELLQAADVAYCPSNAAEEVKKVADKVFEQSCEEDFIAAVIDEIFEKLKK